MRIACLYLPRLSVQVEHHADPTLRDRPLIIGGYHHEMGRVREVSEQAVEYGLTADMPLRQAYSLCPDGVFLPYPEEKCREASSLVLSQVAQLCPLVETESPAHILMGLRYERDESHFGGDVVSAVQRHTGFHVSCGIASSRFAARLAAEEAGMSGVLVLDGSDEQVFLHELPVARLPVPAAIVRRLHLLGITRAGDLMKLPAGALEAQFGSEGQRMCELICGRDSRDVAQWRGAREIVHSMSCDVPCAGGSELREVVRRVLDSLCRELRERWQCCRGLSMVLRLECGRVRRATLHFKEPTSSRAVLEWRVFSRIEQLVSVTQVSSVEFTAFGLCAEEGRQSSFLDGPSRVKTQFGEAVVLLQQRYGRGVVKKVTTRRGGRLPEDQYSLVPCEPERR